MLKDIDIFFTVRIVRWTTVSQASARKQEVALVMNTVSSCRAVRQECSRRWSKVPFVQVINEFSSLSPVFLTLYLLWQPSPLYTGVCKVKLPHNRLSVHLDSIATFSTAMHYWYMWPGGSWKKYFGPQGLEAKGLTLLALKIFSYAKEAVIFWFCRFQVALEVRIDSIRPAGWNGLK